MTRAWGRSVPVPVAALVPVLLPVLLLALSACSGDPQEDYCDAVAARQEQITDLAGSQSPDRLFTMLPILRELDEAAPDDIADDWALVIGRIEDLHQALEDAGADPATFDADDLAALTATDRRAVLAAGRALGAEDAQRAWVDLGQHARDVCRTPLSLS